MQEIEWLQSWYRSQCDGDWEHQYGVRIETLDNPGWSISVDLKGTAVENRPFEPVKRERNENDWIHCRVQKEKFEGFGGPGNLIELIRVLRDWVESSR